MNLLLAKIEALVFEIAPRIVLDSLCAALSRALCHPEVLFCSFAVHLALHVLQQTEWEGRVGWRKPIVFGISNAMVFVSAPSRTES